MYLEQHRARAKAVLVLTTRPVPRAIMRTIEAEGWDVVQSVDMHGAVMNDRDPDNIDISVYRNWSMAEEDPAAFRVSIYLPSIFVKSDLDHLMLAIDPEEGCHSIDPKELIYQRTVRAEWKEEVDGIHFLVEVTLNIHFTAPLTREDIHLLTDMGVIRYEEPYIRKPELIASCEI